HACNRVPVLPGQHTKLLCHPVVWPQHQLVAGAINHHTGFVRGAEQFQQASWFLSLVRPLYVLDGPRQERNEPPIPGTVAANRAVTVALLLPVDPQLSSAAAPARWRLAW